MATRQEPVNLLILPMSRCCDVSTCRDVSCCDVSRYVLGYAGAYFELPFSALTPIKDASYMVLLRTSPNDICDYLCYGCLREYTYGLQNAS